MYAFIALIGLIWGSFLNVVAFRTINQQSIVLPRSHCPHCINTLAWFDLIPVFSYILLGGSCRYCKSPISVFYPIIEILTALLFVLLYKQFSMPFLFSYGLLFSLLIVSIRTDLEYMLIARLFSLCFVPIGIVLSNIGWLPITSLDSLFGALFGYSILWGTAKIFFIFTKKEGIGEGDFELLSLIGSFTGIFGAWLSLSIGSILGSIITLLYLLITKKDSQTKIPFGPFLALGAIVFVFFNQMITTLMNQ